MHDTDELQALHVNGTAAAATTADPIDVESNAIPAELPGRLFRAAATPLETAIAALELGFWPIPITAIDDPTSPAPGKSPIGRGWGNKHWTAEKLRELYEEVPGAGIGLKLGPQGGIIDIDVDDPELGGPILDRMFGREIPETLGWSSTRGRHLIFRWDDRLATLKIGVVKGMNRDGKGHAAYPGIDLRIGWSSEGKQYQSVVPPSPGADGTLRRWNEHAVIQVVPDSLIADLERYIKPSKAAAPTNGTPAQPAAAKEPAKSTWEIPVGTDPEVRAAAYAYSADPAIWGQGGDDQTFKVACLVGPGFDLPEDVAFRILLKEFNPRCEPPWSEEKLRRKVAEAYKTETRPRGWKLLERSEKDTTTKTSNGKATSNAPAAPGATNSTGDDRDDRGGQAAPPAAAAGPGEGKHEPSTNGAVAKGKSKPEELPEITDDDVDVVCLADVVEKEIQWLMPGRIPLRKVVFLGGMQKGGKSFFTADLAARISIGAEIPAGNGECFEPGDVVWLCGEDDLDDTVKPRVRRAGANMGRIFAFNGIKHDRSGRTLSFKLEHVRYLEYVISRRKDPRLVIIDPLAHFVGRMKTRQTEEYREIIGPLKELAAASNTTILLIGHLNKGNSTNAIHRFGGDQAPTQIARANWLLMKDPDDPERRLLLDAGTNLCKEPLGLAFRITDDGRVQWEDKPVEMDANEGLAEAAAKGPARRKEAGKRGPDPIKTTRQAEWLFDYLKARGQAAQLVKIFDAAGEAGLVGEKGPNKKWSAVGNLYKAMDLVPNLPPPRGGFMVKERDMKIGGVGRAFKHWQLVKLPPSDESGQPEPGEPEGIVCHAGAEWPTEVPAQTEVAPEGVPF